MYILVKNKSLYHTDRETHSKDLRISDKLRNKPKTSFNISFKSLQFLQSYHNFDHSPAVKLENIKDVMNGNMLLKSCQDQKCDFKQLLRQRLNKTIFWDDVEPRPHKTMKYGEYHQNTKIQRPTEQKTTKPFL